MKIQFRSRYLALFLGLSAFVACKKDDAPAPTEPTQTKEEVLYESIQGRWDADIPAPVRIQSANAVSGKEQEAAYFKYVEFFGDSTYVLAISSSTVRSGRYLVVDSATVSLEGLAVVKNISFENGEISFTVVMSEDWNNLTFAGTGNKMEALQIPENKKGLLKNWVLSMTEENDFSGIFQELQATSVKRLYTVNGSVITRYYKGDEVIYVTFRNWKWHPTVADAIIEFDYKEYIPEYRYWKISSLSTGTLSIDIMTQMENSEDFEKTSSLSYSFGL